MSQTDIETNAENYEMEDGLFKKKVNLKNDITSEKIAKKFPNVDINEHEIQKSCLTVQKLIVLWNSDDEFSNSGDGINETFLITGKQIHNLSNKQFDSLKLEAVVKKILKTLKALLNLITAFKKVLK